MKLTITIDTENDAFENDLDHEIGAILTQCHDIIYTNSPDNWTHRLSDTNGNTCGSMAYE